MSSSTSRVVALAVACLAALPLQAAGPTLAGCPMFPRNHYWNTRVDNLPLHPKSAAWVASAGLATRLHADWGTFPEDYYGIPYAVVPASQPPVPITYHLEGAPDESEPGPYPIPPDAPIEGGPAAPADSDRHVLVLENGNCRLYELFNAFPAAGGGWQVYSSTRFDLASNALRPLGWTSGDAAGFAILPGLVRYEEAAAGEIDHAIRFTLNLIRGADPAGPGGHAYLWPARHWSGSINNPDYPPMGARFRLKADFDLSGFSPVTQAILRAFKKYGLVLADRGSNWYFQGVTDTRWPDSVYSELTSIAGGSFEAVDTSRLRISSESAQSLQFAPNLDKDLRADVVYRNASTGHVYRLFGNGVALTGGAMAYHEPNLAWSVVAEGDFNGDGVLDLLWRNSATGGVYLLPFAANGLPAGGTLLYTEPNQAWKLVGTPDFDGDNRSDLLWWNANTGQVYAMLSTGTGIGAQGFAYHEPNTAWRIVATGDFAGTGRRNQLLWRNAATGQVYLMTVAFSAGAFTPSGAMAYAEPDTAWKIVGAADFNGDGKSDILYRNDATGQVYVLLMDNAAVIGAGLAHAEADLAWKVAALGDYDGDGRADLLWRHDTTGAVYMMLMNGVTPGAQGPVYAEPNTAWRILGPGVYAP